MTMVTLKGEFLINGKPVTGMNVDTTKSVRFNDASGVLAVVAADEAGKTVKGITMAEDHILLQLTALGSKATKDVTLRMPNL